MKPLTLLFTFAFITLLSCKSDKGKTPVEEVVASPADCIERILAEDSEYGKERNHACETISLSETIAQYTKQLRGMDFSDCPAAFSKAFDGHITAWDSIAPLTHKYPDLRGEMHVLFDSIEKTADSTEFKRLLGAIWSTWGDIEAVQKEYVTDETSDQD
ncbi:hypothetical protein POV27_12165 [Aureisphaera galaxeae]|uniref:hypothetical protein n=1 Tax=Aureisphaera galaxeae TaxID=1538023 RepID=UPI00234FE59B|nr:hypothetical protein [Aureisphaera galaxeae]MDC8004810.1 hypothetical protein [Aureisphaera galaxeae]